MLTPRKLFLVIVVIFTTALYIALPNQLPLHFKLKDFNLDHTFNKQTVDFTVFSKRIVFDPQIKLGLDLQGGTHLVLDANMDKISEEDRLDALESAREIISRRIDLFGVTEPVIQTSVDASKNQYRLIVELPGITDAQKAIDLIGQTAQLEFKEQNEKELETIATPSSLDLVNSFKTTGLTGEHLKKASVEFDNKSGQPVVGLEFDQEGKTMFAEITKRNVGKPVGIFLDGAPVTLPVVQTVITDGRAVISGQFTSESAKNLAIQLNAGALPVPIQVVSQRNVGATLGQISVEKSLTAGLIGLSMVMAFMILYYGMFGLLADMALVVYGVLTLALYKLLSITLTLPGLAGFILSVGMAVDSNILIFERAKEEIRSGKPWKTAIELGFGRAWDSIKDANVATLTTTFILFNPFDWSFLNSSGMVRGFALTLALGILISLFTGIVVTRTLIRLFYKPKSA